MPFVSVPGGMKWRTYNFPKFTGGLADAPKTDTECLQFDNFEVLQDGFARCRRGYVRIPIVGSIGTSIITGLRYDGQGHLIVARASTEGSSFICLDTSSIPFPQYQFFDSGYSPTNDYPVFFEFINTATTSYVFFAGPETTALRSWDYSADTATVVNTFPGVIKHLCWHNGYMYAVVNNTLWFSNPSDPFTWPTASNIPVAVNHGVPLALMSLGDRLLIFCSNGIQYLVGDPSSAFFIGLLAPDIPFNSALQMGAEGGNVAFFSYDNIVQYAGGLSVLSANITSLPLYLLQNTIGPPGMAVSPEYVAVRATTSTGATVLYMYERLRHGTWGRWLYDPRAPLSGAQTRLNLIAYAPIGSSAGFILPGQDGNLYYQPLNSHTSFGADPLWPRVTNVDYPDIPIRSAVATRYTGIIEDRICQKQLRAFSIYGSGTNVSVTFNFSDAGGNVTSCAFPPLNLPTSQSFSLSPTGPRPPMSSFQEAQMTISGENMTIRDVAWFWRPVRYAMKTYAAPAIVEDTDVPPTGTVLVYGGVNAPAGYLLCDGSAVSRSTYSGLFQVIQTAYGTGDGTSTFNVPDCCGRALVGAGIGVGLTARRPGDSFGEETHLLSASESGTTAHTHPGSTTGDGHAFTEEGDATGGTEHTVIASAIATSGKVGNHINANAAVDASASAAHNNLQPSLVFNCIIKT